MQGVINREIPYPLNSLPDYEKQYDLKSIHDAFLEIMVDFDSFCRRNGIMYSIADGTLMGALRHSDFIPWDDDADLMITRDEYEKLRKAIKSEQNIKLMKITFLDRITTAKYHDQNVYCDLFINDVMPSSKIAFEIKKNITRFLRTYFKNTVRNARQDSWSCLKKKAHKIAGVILRACVRLFVRRKSIFDLNDQCVRINKLKPSEYYTRFTSRMYETKRRFNRTSYDEGYGEVVFRGKKLMAIQNADIFLHEMYGDYTVLLPEEKRKPEHPINMMDSSESCVCRYN